MTFFIEWIWRKEGGLLRFPFTVASWCYGFLSLQRALFYKKGIFATKRVDCHVISVGNITVGGTGKTPTVIYLARKWQKKGSSVGIVSRGYRRENRATVLLVSDGTKTLESAEAAGDEPFLMAEQLPGVSIVVSTDRVKGCEYLISHFAVDVILLDDGFQHLRLHRDLNLLLVDTTNPFGNGHLLPRGSLREPLSGIKRADLVIFTRTENHLPSDEIMRRTKLFQANVLQSRFKASALVNLASRVRIEPSDLSGRRVLPFCGIGNPDAFLGQLTRLGAKIEAPILFKDHHDYQSTDLKRIKDAAEKRGVSRIVTTEKDAVKIRRFLSDELKIFALQIELDFKKEDENHLSKLLEK